MSYNQGNTIEASRRRLSAITGNNLGPGKSSPVDQPRLDAMFSESQRVARSKSETPRHLTWREISDLSGMIHACLQSGNHTLSDYAYGCLTRDPDALRLFVNGGYMDEDKYSGLLSRLSVEGFLTPQGAAVSFSKTRMSDIASENIDADVAFAISENYMVDDLFWQVYYSNQCDISQTLKSLDEIAIKEAEKSFY